jgi:hypothetical protein
LLTTPVILTVYNRPQLTGQVIAALRAVRPARMLIVADGGWDNDPDDQARCAEVLRILKSIDWPTQLEWNISPQHLGCRRRIQTGLSWAFERVTEAIILEDDCVAHPSFFEFCRVLLERYRWEERVGLICGTNFQGGKRAASPSYFFSRYPLLWGWATWQRTWDRYEPDIVTWDSVRETSWLADFLGDSIASAYWRHIFDEVRAGLDTWDYSMTFSFWRAGLLAAHPNQNLVRNIGFGPDATHTRDGTSALGNMRVEEIRFPLVHPSLVERATAPDVRTEQILFSGALKQKLRLAHQSLAATRTERGNLKS